MATDVFGKKTNTIVPPLTADNAIFNWGGIVASAVNVSIGYSRGVSRHRTIGNQIAVMVTSQPAGKISVGSIVTTLTNSSFFQLPGWDGCNPGTVTMTLNQCQGNTFNAAGVPTPVTPGTSLQFTAVGCLVSGFNIGFEGEGLVILNNVSIDFLQLISGAGSGSSTVAG
jgi:hypothetical protein